MKPSLRPHEHPAAVSLTAFRDSITTQGPFYSISAPFFTPDNHEQPAQARILRAIKKDLSRRGASHNPSFSPEGVLRGVRTEKGKPSRQALFGVVAKEVTKADLPLITRWYAVASAAHHGVFNFLMMDLPPEPSSEQELKQVNNLLRSQLHRRSPQEHAVLVALGIDQKHTILAQYLSGREDRLSIYLDLAHTLARTFVEHPQIKDTPRYETSLLPALRFYCSHFRKKEDYLTTPNIDLFQKLVHGEKLPDGSYMAQSYSEDQIKEVLKQVGCEARIVEVLFNTVEPEKIKLSKDYLAKLDTMYKLLPNLRQAMPVVGSVWAQSRLTKQAARQVKETPAPARPNM